MSTSALMALEDRRARQYGYRATWREQWVMDKLKQAARLCEAVEMDQHDAWMFLAGNILKVLAEELWPCKYKERRRFVELLVNYTSPSLSARTISVLLLKTFLVTKGWEAEAKAIGERWRESEDSELMLGIEFDVEEHEILAICPNIPRSYIRQFSYANLLYDEVKLGQARAYVRSRVVPSFDVGYIRLEGSGQWVICFGTDWLVALVASAEELSRSVKAERTFTQWWLP